MNKMIFAAFIAGAVLGIVAAWKYSERQEVEEPLNEEMDIYDKQKDDEVETDISDDKSDNPTALVDRVSEIVETDGYSAENPYVIPPDDFDMFEDYEAITLTYYADGVLADDDDRKIDDAENTIGKEALDFLRSFRKDIVYVRNDKRKTDYEICRDFRTYEQVVAELPPGYSDV